MQLWLLLSTRLLQIYISKSQTEQSLYCIEHPQYGELHKRGVCGTQGRK